MRIDSFSAENSIKLAGLFQLLENLNVGDIVKAKVLEIASGEALLKLFDGTTVKASIPMDLELEKGQSLELAVTGKNDGKLYMETVKTPVEPEALVVKQLQKDNVLPDKLIANTAAELKANGLKVSREAIQEVGDTLKAFPAMDLQKAVFMIKNHQNVSEKNIASLTRLTDIKTNISSRLMELEETILNKVDLPVIEKFASAIKNSGNTFTREAVDANNKSSFISFERLNTANTAPEEPVLIDIKDPKIITILPKIKNLIIAESENRNGDNLESNENFLPVASFVKRLLPEQIRDKAPEIIKQSIIMISKETDPAAGVSAKKVENILKEIIKVAGRMETAVNTVKKEFKALDLKLEKGGIEISSEIKKIFKETYSKLETIKNSSDLSNPSARDIYTKAESLQDDIRFMNDIYRYSTYLQLPVNISERSMTGELYVLKKGRGKTGVNKDSSTVFLSLDTPNLGRFEALVEIKSKNIALNVRLENEEAINYFKENFKELYNSLQNNGYRLSDIRYKTIDRPVNLINADKELISSDTIKSIDLKI